MNFKRCIKCGCLCQDTIEKCPQCGGVSFVVVGNSYNDHNNTSNVNDVEPGGSITLGIFLGFFLGFIGLIISCICGQKENGKTMMGVLYGVLANFLIMIIGMIIFFST